MEQLRLFELEEVYKDIETLIPKKNINKELYDNVKMVFVGDLIELIENNTVDIKDIIFLEECHKVYYHTGNLSYAHRKERKRIMRMITKLKKG